EGNDQFACQRDDHCLARADTAIDGAGAITRDNIMPACSLSETAESARWLALMLRLGRTALTAHGFICGRSSHGTGVAIAADGIVLLAIGFFVMGSGLALPYALAPRLALSALSPAQSRSGFGDRQRLHLS